MVTNYNESLTIQTNIMKTNNNISSTQAREYLYFTDCKYSNRVKWSEHKHYGM